MKKTRKNNKKVNNKKSQLRVEIIFKDAAVPKVIMCDNVYTKGEMLCIRDGEYIYKYPLMGIFSVCHKHGRHIGSVQHQREIMSKNI